MPNKMTESLHVLLADTFSLYLKTHKYHWNVEGSDFFELHTFFEKMYTEVWEAVDAIAEHIRILGEYATGSYQEFAKVTTIKAGATKLSATAMIKNLLAGHEAVIHSAKKTLQLAEKASDTVTADFVTARMDAHQKHAWMLRSFLK